MNVRKRGRKRDQPAVINKEVIRATKISVLPIYAVSPEVTTDSGMILEKEMVCTTVRD